MQATWIGYGLGKRVFCDGLVKFFEGKNKYMRFEPTAFHNFSRELFGNSCQILFGTFKYSVTALNICPDLLRTYFFQNGDKLLPRQRAVAANIDAAK